jgi:ABC-2 type transport system ATP-binding protein
MLDEPTVGVDPQSRENLFQGIESFASEGTTVLYTTHYMEEAERLCDRIAIMDEGRIVAVGTREELLEIVGVGEVIEIRGAADATRLGHIPEVVDVESSGDVTRLLVKDAARALGPIGAILAESGHTADGLEVYPVNLERVFMHLTGKELRD